MHTSLLLWRPREVGGCHGGCDCLGKGANGVQVTPLPTTRVDELQSFPRAMYSTHISDRARPNLLAHGDMGDEGHAQLDRRFHDALHNVLNDLNVVIVHLCKPASSEFQYRNISTIPRMISSWICSSIAARRCEFARRASSICTIDNFLHDVGP